MPAALLTSHGATGHIHLIIGANPLAGARCTKSLDSGARPILISPADSQPHYTLAKRVEEGKVEWLKRGFEDGDLQTLGRKEVDRYVDAVFVTSNPRSPQAAHISSLCRRLRIPINVADAPNLCTFTLLSTHSDGPLQIGITTSGKGCKLASRIRREVAASLPPNLGVAIDRLGVMRRRIWEEDHKQHDAQGLDDVAENSDDDASGQSAKFNKLVLESDRAAIKTRRMRWLTQICEYWPLRRLAEISDADIDSVLSAYQAEGNELAVSPPPKSEVALKRKPRIILAGSGPGSPHLLTMATHRAIQNATFVLADKLVPSAVMDLIPRRATVHIARKFPGNAEAAQQELLSLGLQALQSGQHATVLRLKQGDPYIYGRGGEEVDFFRKEGVEVTVLPGITSALSAPLFARIPATHRAVADKVLICTGTGRKGKMVRLPDYDSEMTLIVLMGLHRLEALVDTLVGKPKARPPIATGVSEVDVVVRARHEDRLEVRDRGSKVEGGEVAEAPEVPLKDPWPKDTPCAVLERASCPDQRVIRTTLRYVVDAVEQEGSRPPGLFVIGKACEALESRGGSRWIVEDGFEGLDGLMEGPERALEGIMMGSSQEREIA